MNHREPPANVDKTVKIILVGPLKSATGRSQVNIELRKEQSLREVISRVVEETGGRGAEYLAGFEHDPEKLVVSVDGEVTRDLDRRIKGGETIMLTPPLSGGSQHSVRCLNCSSRVEVEQGAGEATCSSCGTRYSITWVTPTQPKVRGVAR
ncbi:MAG TPA: hypothetical protein EYH45_06835 [Candidatus Caldiarchaeum subterraneum]|uniref:MoaD/ThiS family protein n=1 Tax=Caldiarchaeum subterraneum TaxID=311458 RepID=A0A832ZXP3_CALS0|nr:hypothetical protein [Candidatus Caldarchaeum subterraneum]